MTPIITDLVFFAAIAVIALVGLLPLLWVVYSSMREDAEWLALRERERDEDRSRA